MNRTARSKRYYEKHRQEILAKKQRSRKRAQKAPKAKLSIEESILRNRAACQRYYRRNKFRWHGYRLKWANPEVSLQHVGVLSLDQIRQEHDRGRGEGLYNLLFAPYPNPLEMLILKERYNRSQIATT